MTDAPLTRVLTAHRERMRYDYATYLTECVCGWEAPARDAEQRRAHAEWIAHVVALVAAETQAELARQFTSTRAVSGSPDRTCIPHSAVPCIPHCEASIRASRSCPPWPWPKGWR